MSIDRDCICLSKKGQSGNVLVVVLVVLVIAAVGAMAFMSGKMGGIQIPKNTEEVASSSSPADPAAGQPDPVVAKVNGTEIKRSEVIQLVNMMPPQMQQIPMEQLLPIAIEQLVNNKIIDNKSSGANLDRDPDVVKQLASAKEQIVRSKFVENAVIKEMSPDRLKSKYDEYVKNFPKNVEEVKAAHILVKEESKAKEIIKQLDGGKVFADLAKENSTDGTAKNGGELGYFTKQDVVSAFADAAFATKPGEYTKKPVKSEFGYHIIKVEEKRIRPPAEFEQAKGFLEQEVRREILDEVVKKWRDEAKIERFDLNGQPLPEKQEPAAGSEAQGQNQEQGQTQPQAQEAPASEEEAKPAE